MGTRIRHLPDPETLVAEIREGTQVRERIFREYCRDHGIAFISLTEPLRQATRQGRQTFFTFDQHWTPEGHTVVAEYLSEQIVVPE